MRIAFITPEYTTEETYSGGLANYLGRISTALASRGHDINVFTKSYVANEQIDHHGVCVHRVIPLWDRKLRVDKVDRFAPRSLYAPYQDMKAAWSLWRRWKTSHDQQSYDVVQVANVLAVGWFFNWARGVPVTTRLSSYRPAWDSAFGVEMNLSVRARWWLERKAIQRSKHLYAPSQFVADLTEQNYHVPPVRVIESPFHQEVPIDDDSGIDPRFGNNEYVLFFGRQTQMKGVHLLAQALSRLMSDNPKMHAVFVGRTGQSPTGGCMQEYIQSLLASFDDRLHILDSLRHAELYPIVRNAKVVALPSLIDNLPNTCLEAMGLGRVVVATSGTCFEQLIEDGKSGILCKPNDVDDLEAAIMRAWVLDDQERAAISSNASKRIQKLHPDHKIPELLDYFAEIS